MPDGIPAVDHCRVHGHEREKESVQSHEECGSQVEGKSNHQESQHAPER